MGSPVMPSEEIALALGLGVIAGRYVLDEIIGSGGMGVVFGGRDRRTGAKIAVKRLHERFVDDPQRRLWMAHEVRAMARLNHPGVVRVLDFGFEQGSPYVVMERIEGRPLSAYVQVTLEWPQIRALGLAILRTLAHAHAREVVHLDLKPANILVTGPTAVKIVDFGIARLTDAHDVADSLDPPSGPDAESPERAVRGSRGYMAPEQAAADESRIGPTSDLYAVGVILYLMVTGNLPYPTRSKGPGRDPEGDDPAAREPRPLVPRSPIPDEARPILASLLATDCFARGEFAADYVRRLAATPGEIPKSLPRLSGDEEIPRSTPASAAIPEGTEAQDAAPTRRLDLGDPKIAAGGTVIMVDGGLTIASNPPTGSRPDTSGGRTGTFGATQDPETERISQPPGGGGPSRWGLFGVREPLIAGRAREQGFLLQPAVEVLQDRAARVRILRGVTGIGKSRLARWILQRSREDGSFRGLAAFYGRGGPNGGVRGALRDWLRVRGAPQDEVAKRAKERLGCSTLEAYALALVLRPGGVRPGHREGREVERALLIALRHLCRQRPLLLWIDDAGASAGSGAYKLVLSLLAADEAAPLPLYVVATESNKLPAEDAAIAARLEAHPATRVLDLERLDDETIQRIATDLLPLDAPTLNDVARRAVGNPLYAMHLLAHWVETDQLKRTDSHGNLGRVADGRFRAETLRDVMRARLDGIAARSPDPARELEILERVGMLGRRVPHELLVRAIAVEERADLLSTVHSSLERWLATGIVRENEPEVIEIEQRELASLLARRAAERPSYRDAQRACAVAKKMMERAGEIDPGSLQEIAGHLLEGGAPLEAAEQAIEAGWRARQLGHPAQGLKSLDFAAKCLAAFDSSEERGALEKERLSARLGYSLADAKFRIGRVEEARAAASAGVLAGRRSGDAHALAMALVAEGDVLRRTGQVDAALDRLLEASELSRAQDLSEPLSRACHSLAYLAYARGDLDLAESIGREAVAAARRAGEPWTSLWSESLLRAVALARHDFEGALAGIDEARRESEACGFTSLVFQIDQSFGEIALARGHADLALDHFQRAAAMLEVLGDPYMDAYAHLNIGIALLKLDRPAEADAAAALGEAITVKHAFGPYRRSAAVLRACAAAALGEWDRCAEQLAFVLELAPELELLEIEFARLLVRTGDLALAAGRIELGRSALTRAAAILRRFKAEPEVRAIEDKLRASEP
jgi:eukaryotic-like serine/threonine-protein kinase